MASEPTLPISILRKCGTSGAKLVTAATVDTDTAFMSGSDKCQSSKTLLCLFFLVALNFQTAGEGMDLNDGLFRQNGSCGYVLKPRFMRGSEKRFNPEMPQNRDGYQPVVLTIQVYLQNNSL